ncbi:MAG: DUF1080 domain-containing protein [Pirellulales bacterium]|nr:DUF1080 domain-containing protein [Pirellulales bacterium]
MRRVATGLIILLLTISKAVAAPNALSRAENVDGYIRLFDGETLFGWQATSDANWQVEDGAIRVTQGEPGWLMTTSQFSDYELVVEFKAPATTNSGIFLSTASHPQDPTKDCYELNIAPPDNLFPTGSLVGRKRTGKLPRGPEFPNAGSVDLWDGNWHTFVVTCAGTTVRVRFDGYPWYEYQDTEPHRRGHIGLQFREGEVAFRNIRLRLLEAKPIFNGRDLTGWNTERGEKSQFSVTPKGELRVLDGRGQIETDASYGDFVLQTECFVDGNGLNSGLFFRCIPREFLMGYECQIHNGTVDGNPTRPQDCGTGGIFRRQNARRIVARDYEWFAITLVADGPHMAAWVNGTQVSDWTDTRSPHENPRKGLRLEPGTIAIQGHDPTTDLRFRELRIQELAKSLKDQ